MFYYHHPHKYDGSGWGTAGVTLEVNAAALKLRHLPSSKTKARPKIVDMFSSGSVDDDAPVFVLTQPWKQMQRRRSQT